MSYAEDMGLDSWEPTDDSLSFQWTQGYHTMRNGESIDLELMTDNHIKNTIKMFEDKQDVTPLKEELKKREIIRNPNL